MGDDSGAESLEGLLERISNAHEEEDSITMEAVLQAAGTKSFGPMLLVPGLIALSPLSGIPGMPTLVGVMVLLISGQLLIGRSEFWMPQFVLRRAVSRTRFEKAVKMLRKVARFVDRLLKPRLSFFTKGVALYAIAALCVLLSLAAPFLELLPFVITGVGAAVSAFGLALVAHDGVLAILALVFCAGVIIASGMALM